MTDSTAGAPAPAAPSTAGKTLGIVGLILDFFFPVIGLILSIIARSQSKQAGIPNTPATVGIVVGIIIIAGYIIGGIVLGVSLGAVANECATLGAGVHHVGSTTYTCGS